MMFVVFYSRLLCNKCAICQAVEKAKAPATAAGVKGRGIPVLRFCFGLSTLSSFLKRKKKRSAREARTEAESPTKTKQEKICVFSQGYNKINILRCSA